MKIPKALLAIVFLKTEAHAAVRGLEEVDLDGETADCAYPCSMGSCDWDSKEPWDSVGNEEEIEQYPFTFVLKKGTPYRISMKRDETQCAMRLVNWGIHDENGDRGMVDCSYSAEVTDSCGTGGGLVLEDCKVPETGTYTVYLSMETIGEDDCPRKGFEYSIEISPPPLDGIERDGSCTAEQRAFVRGEGMISAAHTSTHVGPLPTNFEIDLEHRSVDSRADPRGKIEAPQFGSRRRAIILTAGDLTFFDTHLDWLFINEEEGCARFQGKGSVLVNSEVVEKDVFFDTIVFNKGDNSDAKDTFQMQIDSDNGVDPYWYSVFEPAELDQGDILSLSNVGNDGKPPVAFPLGDCEGDCDSDYDCEDGLVCYMRDKSEPVPRCWGEDGTGGTSGTDYCVVRPPKYLQIPLLGECQGDCDTDRDCKGDLVCFERKKFTPVPGCDGAGARGRDYCVSPDASSSSSTSSSSDSNDPTHAPTRLCPLIQPEPWDDVSVQVTPVGSVPVVNTAPGSYNMLPIENFENLYVVDQVEGLIYRHDEADGAVELVFDASVMEGELDFNITYPEPIWNGGDQKISTLYPGRTSDEVIINFQTSVVPDALLALGFDTTRLAGNTNADLQVPTDDVPGDGIYRLGEPTSGSVYKTFYKFKVDADGMFVDGVPFFSYERARNTFGHDGGAGFTAPNGKILVPVGDCLPFGTNGRRAAQDLDEHCGKILLIDPEDGTFDIAATGVRNSQQIANYKDGLLYIMDIGGITAEEVNVVSLDALLDTSEIENFGWGMREGEDFAREGTFKVEAGTPLVFAGPVCVGEQTRREARGFVKPWFQFGRGPDLPLFGITSAIVSDASFDKIKLATTEFNTGKLLVAKQEYEEGKTLGAFDVPIYDENMVRLSAGFNNLTQFGDRNDPRLFLYSDGTAGLFLERTGHFFRLTEI